MLVPALGLSAWFCAADSTIRAERLSWAVLQAAPSSFHRRLLSCSSSLDLLGIRSVSLTEGESWRELGLWAPRKHLKGLQATLCRDRMGWNTPDHLQAWLRKESPLKGGAGAPGSV